MPKILERCVREVKARASIVEIVEPVVRLRRAGASLVGLCPFHEEKSGSFHVFERTNRFKCFGCGKGGDALAFVMEREGLDFIGAIEAVARRCGVALEYEERRGAPMASPAATASEAEGAAAAPAGAAVMVLPDGVSEKTAKKAMRDLARRQRERDAVERLEEERARALRPAVERRDMPAWSAAVAARFEEGRQHLSAAANAEELAAARGWPVSWVYWLLEEGHVSLPLLPWRDRDAAGARGVAWRVCSPEMGVVADRDVCTGLRTVGYHQRFTIEDKKQWTYVPYSPALEDAEGRPRRLSEFQRTLAAEAGARAIAVGEGMLQGVPFVLGVPASARRLVVAEGQWDAVTFAGAMGWLAGDTSWPDDTLVMGARGNNGVDVALAWWGRWISWQEPRVLALADNDAAGRRWDQAEETALGEAPRPTFADKLGAAGAAEVQVSRVRREFGKDFNDYWRARKPSTEAMAAWLDAMAF